MRPSSSYDSCIAVLDIVDVSVAGCVKATGRHVCLARCIHTWTVDLGHIFERSIGSNVAIFEINLVQQMLEVAFIQAWLL